MVGRFGAVPMPPHHSLRCRIIGLAIVAATVVTYALVASRLERVWISGPMVFLAAGVVLGPAVTDQLPVTVGHDAARVVTEGTLALVLFADASMLRLWAVERDAWTPGRLLLVGLPLTMAFGTLLALGLFPGIGLAAAALIAVIVAPTDAALGMAVVTNSSVPRRIRRTLNVESGLNDGIATPFVAVLVTIVVAEERVEGGSAAVQAVAEVGLALFAALVVGGLGGRLLCAAHERRWTSPQSEQLAIIGLALLSYGFSVAIGGNGFIAAFAGGLLFGAATERMLEARVEFTEATAVLASYLVWIIFGAIFVGPVLAAGVELAPILYAVASLTLIRMLPVAAALLRTGFRLPTVLFIGWFGPRGLASVVFALVALEALGAEGLVADTVAVAVTWTVLLSVAAHGITAPSLARAYGDWTTTLGDVPETMAVPEPRSRLRTILDEHGLHVRPSRDRRP